jgi:hypothetical protein
LSASRSYEYSVGRSDAEAADEEDEEEEEEPSREAGDEFEEIVP